MQGIQNSNIYIHIYICKYIVYMHILNVYKYIYEKNNFGDFHFLIQNLKVTVIRNINNLRYADVAAAAAKSLQSCPTLCNPIDGSPQGFPIPGILQARTLEYVAISFSNA